MAAEGSAIHIIKAAIWLELTAGFLQVVQAVQVSVVLVEQEGRAVISIGAVGGHNVDDGALIAAILCREAVGDDLKLLHCILEVNEECRTRDAKVVIVGSVNL